MRSYPRYVLFSLQSGADNMRACVRWRQDLLCQLIAATQCQQPVDTRTQ